MTRLLASTGAIACSNRKLLLSELDMQWQENKAFAAKMIRLRAAVIVFLLLRPLNPKYLPLQLNYFRIMN
jgi:hypothetical protein